MTFFQFPFQFFSQLFLCFYHNCTMFFPAIFIDIHLRQYTISYTYILHIHQHTYFSAYIRRNAEKISVRPRYTESIYVPFPLIRLWYVCVFSFIYIPVYTHIYTVKMLDMYAYLSVQLHQTNYSAVGEIYWKF